MQKLLMVICFGLGIASVTASAKNLTVVEGNIKAVKPEHREIYVTAANKQIYEYYFTKDTTVSTPAGMADFAALKVGQKVKVTAIKKGKALKPEKVEILD